MILFIFIILVLATCQDKFYIDAEKKSYCTFSITAGNLSSQNLYHKVKSVQEAHLAQASG